MVHLNLFVLQLFKFNHIPLPISVRFNQVLNGFLLFSAHFNELTLVFLVYIGDKRAYRQAVRIFGVLPCSVFVT